MFLIIFSIIIIFLILILIIIINSTFFVNKYEDHFSYSEFLLSLISLLLSLYDVSKLEITRPLSNGKNTSKTQPVNK